MDAQFIDFHMHPAIKPLGKSFNRKAGVNSTNRHQQSSIWYADAPSLLDKLANITTTLTKFRQADFTTLAKGGAHTVVASLCGLEKGFVMTKLGTKLPGDIINNLVIGMGRDRINYVQALTDYFADMELEYRFYKQLDGHKLKIEGLWHCYRIVSSFEELEAPPEPGVRTINVVLSIEGGHSFNTGLQRMGRTANPVEVLANVDRMKSWEHPVFFMGMTHHFDNELVGHARSLSGIVSKMCDQTDRMNEGFSELGWQVLRKLLDDNNGRRVLIDLKHMSVKAREEYYAFLEQEYPDEVIPLIVSHGAVTGFRSSRELVEDDLHNYGKFLANDINFYDDELVRIAKSGGIFGIQLDERRVASKMELKKSGPFLSRRKMLFYQSKLVWNQIQHIAEVLNRNDLFAWGIQSIGSDFDGMINPLNGFWTAEDMPLFDSYLEKHAFNFLQSDQSLSLHAYNRIKASDIVDRFMKENAYSFLQKHF